jgi:hypothetical protein
MTRNVLLLLGFLLQYLVADAQLRGNSYLNDLEIRYLKSSFYSSAQPDKLYVPGGGNDSVIAAKAKELRACSAGRLHKVFPSTLVSVVRIYKCQGSMPIDSVWGFDTDLSEMVAPYWVSYYFFEKDSTGYETELFKVRNVSGFRTSLEISCKKDFEMKWNRMKTVILNKGWRIEDVILYNISEVCKVKNRKLEDRMLLCYRGVSYLWEGGDFVLLRTYLEANYTLEEYRNCFFQ